MEYCKTKYYPVDINRKIIYLIHYKFEKNCLTFSRKTIPIKGNRLNQKDCYKSFEIISDIPAEI